MNFTKEHDRFLPIANISRIMKKALPENAKLSREAKESVQECVSEFISFITSEAAEKCKNEKRKTINGEDILIAMNNLGFENYIDILKIYLTKFRQASKQEEEKGSSKNQIENENENSIQESSESENEDEEKEDYKENL